MIFVIFALFIEILLIEILRLIFVDILLFNCNLKLWIKLF